MAIKRGELIMFRPKKSHKLSSDSTPSHAKEPWRGGTYHKLLSAITPKISSTATHDHFPIKHSHPIKKNKNEKGNKLKHKTETSLSATRKK
jgi:hypothetical protein